MTADLSFSGSGPSRAYTPAARKADGTLSTPTDTTIVELAASGNQARAADIAALQSALLTALGLLATDQDVMAGNAKLEAIRLLLATPVIAGGAATDTSVQAVTAKLEAIRLLQVTPALPAGAALDASLQSILATLGTLATHADEAADIAKLEAIRVLLAAALTVQGTVTANLGTLNGAALDTSLQSILTVLQAQRAETLWTDDTNAFFVRVDKGGAITWTDPSGNAASAPGTGARPAAGTSAIVDSSRYQATAAATGYSIGDYLSHIVTSDPSTGAVIGHFWLNVTTEAKLASAPVAGNITPIAPLPAGAATSALQTTGNASLSAIASALAGTLAISAAALPLPAGAATGAKQDTGNTSLASIATALASILGVSATDGALATVGAKADAAAAFGAASASLVALLKNIATAEAPFQGAIALTAGTPGTAGRALRVNCTAAGNITLTYADGSTDTVPVNVGLSYLPGAITTASIPGSGGATATFANMK